MPYIRFLNDEFEQFYSTQKTSFSFGLPPTEDVVLKRHFSFKQRTVRASLHSSQLPLTNVALSGGNNRATTLFLYASPYRAIVHPYRPQVQHHIGATTILTRG